MPGHMTVCEASRGVSSAASVSWPTHATLELMADLLADLEIALWSVFFLVPVGRARDFPRLTAADYESAFERLWKQSLKQKYGIKTTEAPHYRRFALRQQKSRKGKRKPGTRFRAMGVNDGKGIMFVSHTGLIFPSGRPLSAVCFLFSMWSRSTRRPRCFKPCETQIAWRASADTANTARSAEEVARDLTL